MTTPASTRHSARPFGLPASTARASVLLPAALALALGTAPARAAVVEEPHGASPTEAGSPAATESMAVPARAALASGGITQTRLAARAATRGGGAVDPQNNDDWAWVESAPPRPPGDGTKSVGKAVVASLILPGMGERSVGHVSRGRVLNLVEAAVWGSFAFYRIQGDRREDRQVEFANLSAGAPLHESDDYYEHIGLWLSLEEWHDIVRRDARLQYPDDAAAQETFFQANKRYDESQAWSWPDDGERTKYRQLRSRTERSYRNARMSVGVAVFHRLASVIDSFALARRHNGRVLEKRARADFDLRIAPRVADGDLVVGPVVTARY